MVNGAAENTLRGKRTFSLNYILAPAKVNEKRPGIDRDHQDLRPDPLVLQPHQQIPPQPPLRAGRADRAKPLQPARNTDRRQVHQEPPTIARRSEPEPGSRPVPDAAGERPAMPEGRELRLRRQVHRRDRAAGGRLAPLPRRGERMRRYGNLWDRMISFESLLLAAHAAARGK